MTTSGVYILERAARLRRDRRRQISLAWLLSLLLHGVILLGFATLAPPRMGKGAIGYPGPMRLVDLAPLSEIRAEQEALAQSRARTGALVSREVRLRPQPEQAESPTNQRGEVLARPRDRMRRPQPAQPKFELGEDWSAQQSSSPVPLSEEVQTLLIVRPEYPRAAIRRGLQGLVRIEAEIDSAGRVGSLRVLGPAETMSVLEEAAAGAMQQWRFQPLRRDGRTVPFTVVVPFRFRLLD